MSIQMFGTSPLASVNGIHTRPEPCHSTEHSHQAILELVQIIQLFEESDATCAASRFASSKDDTTMHNRQKLCISAKI